MLSLRSVLFSRPAIADPAPEAIEGFSDLFGRAEERKSNRGAAVDRVGIDAGATAYKKIDVPADWANAVDEDKAEVLKGKPELVKQVKDILDPIDRMDGDSLPVGAGCCRLREARRRRLRSHLGRDQVHPVQQLCLRLPARYHPSLRSHRGGGQERSRRCQDR